MTQQKIGLIVISPMIIGTAVLLMREGALSVKGVVAVAIAVTTISTFLFLGL